MLTLDLHDIRMLARLVRRQLHTKPISIYGPLHVSLVSQKTHPFHFRHRQPEIRPERSNHCLSVLRPAKKRRVDRVKFRSEASILRREWLALGIRERPLADPGRTFAKRSPRPRT